MDDQRFKLRRISILILRIGNSNHTNGQKDHTI